MFLSSVLSLFLAAQSPESLQALDLPELLVVSRKPQPGQDLALSVSAISVDESVKTHPNEIFDAIPGSWVSRGSGQEHLTAIRSPVLTGAGACGAFLYLENQIPIRPAGFCNVNNLFELNLEQAQSVEVIRGPGSALYGSNALHGAINVLMPTAGPARNISLSVGENDYRRADLSLGWESDSGVAWLAQTSLLSSGSFRQNENYDQQKLYLSWQSDRDQSESQGWLSATNLNQETAGFIFGEDAYLDPVLRRSNVNPEAFRNADSVRLAQRWRWQAGDWAYELTPYARRSRMQFLQHFLPGQPLEENGHESLGLQWLADREYAQLDIRWGLDFEWADSFLIEDQANPISSGSAFLQETRPVGIHYDFEVQSYLLAVYGQSEWHFADDWTLSAGLRLETLDYDYDNRASDGNTREDGTTCGFGGCLFSRPSDRGDRFTELAPKFSLSHRIDNNTLAYLRLARGFRAPQSSELYRLQSDQQIADLEPEKLDSVELGIKSSGTDWALDVAGFYTIKRNVILRDADGFNVSDGRTRHRGLEVSWVWAINADWRLESVAAYQLQDYAFLRDIGRGEVIVPGNRIDTAPKTIAQVRLERRLGDRHSIAAQWRHQGSYFLNASNTASYPGHDLLNLDWRSQLNDQWSLELQMFNATNRRYAERADFAFGNFRYFPGQGRTLLLNLDYRG